MGLMDGLQKTAEDNALAGNNTGASQDEQNAAAAYRAAIQKEQSDPLGNHMGEIAAAKDAYDKLHNAPHTAGYSGGIQDWGRHYAGLADAATNRQAPQIDQRFSNYDRELSLNNLAGLKQTAEGGGAAQQAVQGQFNQNLGQSMASSNALAASARGGGPGLAAAQNAAITGNANAVGQSAQAAGVARAQLANQAQMQYGQLSGQQQGMDAQLAGQQAGLQAGQNALNQTGQLGFYGLGNNLMEGQLSADSAKYGTDVNAATAKYAADQQMTGQIIGGGTSAAGGFLGGSVGSDINMKSGIAPAGASGGLMSSATPYAKHALSEGTKARSPMNLMAGLPPNATPTASLQSMPMQPMAAQQSPMMVSDGNLKSEVRPGGDTEADRFLATMKPFSYRYDNPAHEPTDSPTGGRYLGIMAQNAERGPTGDTIVKETPAGKALEGRALMSAMAAGEGRLHERLAHVEGKLAGMRR
jgi:hypothetical protein